MQVIYEGFKPALELSTTDNAVVAIEEEFPVAEFAYDADCGKCGDCGRCGDCGCK